MAYVCHDVALLENIWLGQRSLGKPAALSKYYLTSTALLNIIVFLPALSLQWELILTPFAVTDLLVCYQSVFSKALIKIHNVRTFIWLLCFAVRMCSPAPGAQRSCEDKERPGMEPAGRGHQLRRQADE